MALWKEIGTDTEHRTEKDCKDINNIPEEVS